MNTNSIRSKLSLVLCVVLIAALALFAAGCASDGETDTSAKTFTFVIVDKDGKETTHEITTSAATVGEALLAEGLIEGEEGQYGLYVKTVGGTTLDYETDGMYWSFYIGEEYALTGVDATEITDGETYAFKAESAE